MSAVVQKLHCQRCLDATECTVHDDDPTKRECKTCGWVSHALRQKRAREPHAVAPTNGAAASNGHGLPACECEALRAELAEVTADRDRWVRRMQRLEARIARGRQALEGGGGP
jgi:hypothetical protein